jgi:glycerol-3-phosphate dehydrogenase (NAD(P)+)
MSQQTAIALLGDGGWGTALSIILHTKGYEARLWSPFPDYAEVLKDKRENVKYLPGIRIPAELPITSEIEEACCAAGVIVLAAPSHHLREVCERARSFIASAQIIVSATKGLEESTLLRMSEIIEEVVGTVPLAVLSGPTLAREVATGHPTAAVVSSTSPAVARAVQGMFSAKHFRLYTSRDVVGVELGGALKNVIAIAAGIIDGLGLGANTKSALLTRGLVEMARLGVTMGADRGTFSGLSGLGDLFTTATSKLSRNHSFGFQVGKGVSVSEAESSTEMVIEGIRTAKAAVQLAQKQNVEMPIATEVYRVLYEGKPPREAIATLMARPPKPELEEELE